MGGNLQERCSEGSGIRGSNGQKLVANSNQHELGSWNYTWGGPPNDKGIAHFSNEVVRF
jgi:hypothetical protein